MTPSILPLQHFRRGMAQLAAVSGSLEPALAGTGIVAKQLESSEFELTPEVLWQITANLRQAFGTAWYLAMPSLWGLEIHGALEGAMRFAPTLAAALEVAERHGHVRWPLARWQVRADHQSVRISSHRSGAIAPEDWQMIGVLIGLNFQTILESAFPDVLNDLSHEYVGSPPLEVKYQTHYFRGSVRWNLQENAALLPVSVLGMPSNLADKSAHDAMLAVLQAQDELTPIGWHVRVANILGDSRDQRLRGEDVANRLGTSLRTLERNLAIEGTSFKALSDTGLRSRFEALVRREDCALAQIAAKLGYSDETALSRATRRWYGETAAVARRRVSAV